MVTGAIFRIYIIYRCYDYIRCRDDTVQSPCGESETFPFTERLKRSVVPFLSAEQDGGQMFMTSISRVSN